MLVLCTKTSRLAPSKSGFLALIGVVFTILGLTQTAGYSGACFNPAVAIAQVTYQWTQAVNTDNELTRYLWMYIMGPMTGGVLAGILHRFHLRAFKIMQ